MTLYNPTRTATDHDRRLKEAELFRLRVNLLTKIIGGSIIAYAILSDKDRDSRVALGVVGSLVLLSPYMPAVIDTVSEVAAAPKSKEKTRFMAKMKKLWNRIWNK